MISIKEKILALPIIQGGMGVGVSLGNLAGHVAKEGAMGIISTANPGYRDPDFWRNSIKANIKAIKEEITKAKDIAVGKGLVGINAMVATTQYRKMVRAAVDAGADVIISGAGLPIDLPSIVKGDDVAIAPIVSSGKAARVICRLWDRNDAVCPDFIVVEGKEAGGHLGFSKDAVKNDTAPELTEIVQDVLTAIVPFEEKYGRKIPVFAAGGVYTGEDIAKFTNMGAAGVQMGTRFAATHECDADIKFKEKLVSIKKEDIVLVKSPVGMPGRALRSKLTETLETQDIPVEKCINCLFPCDYRTTPYCITDALEQAVRGNYDDGLFFSGSQAYRIDKIVHVSELIDELMTGWKKAKI